MRVADKRPTMLFSFCRQWVWDQTQEFLTHEGYNPQPLMNKQIVQTTLRNINRKNGWPHNPSQCIPHLYLLGKAKMLLRGTSLWRPIAAVMETEIQRFYLRTAAGAFTAFLRLLTEEECASFLVLKITDL